MKEVVNKEVQKLLEVGMIYPIIHNEKNEFIATSIVTGWRMSIDYRKLNQATGKDHFHYLL